MKLGIYHKRLKIIAELGGACKECGFSDIRALQLDHKYGNGLSKKLEVMGTLLRVYRRRIEKLQVLYANHNWIKRYKRQEVKKGQQFKGIPLPTNSQNRGRIKLGWHVWQSERDQTAYDIEWWLYRKSVHEEAEQRSLRDYESWQVKHIGDTR